MAGRADIEAGRAFVSLYVKTSEFANGLVNAENRLKAFAASMGAIGRIIADFSPKNLVNELTSLLTRLGTAISTTLNDIGESLTSAGKRTALVGATIGTSLVAAAAHFAHTGDEIAKMSERTGIGTNALSELGYAAGQSGATLDDLETGVRRMQKTIAEAAGGSKTATEDLAKLGLTADQLSGMTPDQQFERIADAVAGIEDPTERAAAAMSVLGKNGTQLIPLMAGGAAGIRKLKEEFVSLGGSITPADAKAAVDLGDAWGRLKTAAMASVFKAGAALAPMLMQALDVATDLASQFGKWVSENRSVIQFVGKLTLGLLGVSGVLSVVGGGFIAVAKVVGVITAAVGGLGSIVATLLPIVSIGLTLLSLAGGIGPIIAFVGSIGSAVAASGVLATALGLIGTVAATVLPAIMTIAAGVAGVFAALAVMAAGAVSAASFAAFAFWKLTDPIKSLLPLARSVVESFSAIGAAIMRGDWGGAADAAIEGMRVALLRGTDAILTMMRNAFAKLPSFINDMLSGTSGVIGAIVGKIEQLFAKMWPAIQLSFTVFASFARDVLNQLPAIAGYAAGRMARAFVDAFAAVQRWMLQASANIAISLVKSLSGIGPALIKSMFTGDVAGVVRELSVALGAALAAGGAAEGFAIGDMPGFAPSQQTIAAWKELEDSIGGVKQTITSTASGAAVGSGGGATKPISSSDASKIEADRLSIDLGPLEKYRTRLLELGAAFSSGVIDEQEFSAGLVELRRDTLGVDPSPLDQYRERLALLSAALRDGTITTAQWTEQATEAQQTILGINPSPLSQFTDRVKLLRAALDSGAITQQQYADDLRQTGQEIFALNPSPLQQLRERVLVLNQALNSGAISQAQWTEEFTKSRREILGIEASPLTQFAERAKQLRDQLSDGSLSFGEYSAEFRKSQQDFLGFDSDPIETYKNKLLELRQALAGGLITKDAFQTAAVAAIPDKIKSIVDETRTPLEKYKKELSELNKLKSVLDPTTFARKEKQLKNQYFSDLASQPGPSATPLVTYSAAGAAAAGRGGGGGSPQERLLAEAKEARKIRDKQLEEARLARRATERLADGMRMR